MYCYFLDQGRHPLIYNKFISLRAYDIYRKFGNMAIIKVELIVCEEDYKYDVSDDKEWEAHSKEILSDVNNIKESFVWREYWLVDEDNGEYADWTIHELMGRTYRILSDEVVCK